MTVLSSCYFSVCQLRGEAAAQGAAAELEAVFRFSDICNALMCLPNLVCLLLLSGATARELEEFQPEVRRKRRRKT